MVEESRSRSREEQKNGKKRNEDDGLNHKKVYIKFTPKDWKKEDMEEFLETTQLPDVELIQLSQRHVFFLQFEEEVELEEVRKEFRELEGAEVYYNKKEERMKKDKKKKKD